jgi:hypothetical protein
VPAEVQAFAAEQGVSAYLPAVVDMTQRVFPSATVELVVEDDPEIANDRHIVLITKAKNLTVEKAMEWTWQWHSGLFANCPAPLVCVFRLGLEGFQ